MKKIITILLVLLIAVSSVFACDCKECKAKAKDAFIREMKANIPEGFIAVSIYSYSSSGVIDTDYPLLINVDNIVAIRPYIMSDGSYRAKIYLVENIIYSVITHESYIEVSQMIADAQKKADQ